MRARRDERELYLAMRHLAEAMRVMGADQIIYITEMWLEREDRLEPRQMPSESPSRMEALVCVAATARGAVEFWCSPFTREADGEIDFGEPMTTPMHLSFRTPVLMMWEGFGRDARAADDAPATLVPRIIESKDSPVSGERDTS